MSAPPPDPAPDRARLKTVFEAACERPSHERTTYLDEATAGEPAVRAGVESLLKFDEDSDDLFGDGRIGNGPWSSATSAPQFDADGPFPEHIGAYRIIRRIGAGGMGCVYEAEQALPRRRVALKVMRLGRGASQLAKRFEREGQIQARLNHPAIAAVYETGIDAATGTPFFAMELVEGEPLMDFVRTHNLTVPDRLRLAADLCDAVSAAHQRGVVHRDLKPDNILVRVADARAQPKISVSTGDVVVPAGWSINHSSQSNSFGFNLQNAPPAGILTDLNPPAAIHLGQWLDREVRLDFFDGVVFPGGQYTDRTTVLCTVQSLTQLPNIVVSTSPDIAMPPSSATFPAGSTAMLSLDVHGIGAQPPTFQWRQDGVNITPGGRFGVGPGGALTISSSRFSDTGVYDCIVNYGCGVTIVGPVALGIYPSASSCAADFNRDGHLQVQDIFDFLAAWFAGCP